MIYFKYIKMLLKTWLQYRIAMWLTILGQFFVSFFLFLGMYLLFERFGTISGWTFGEVAICFAVIQTSFAISECFARGFDMFSNFIIKGEFDRVLLRPRSTILQIFGSEFEITRIGRLIQSFVVLGLAISWLNVPLDFIKTATLILMIISGVVIFTGIFILGATICFYTVEGLEVVNIFTDGGKEIAAYPLNIYNKWLTRFFTFIIPFGCVNYLPLMFITGRTSENPILYMLTPIFGMAFIIPCILVWRIGVRRYVSTGS